MGAITYKCPNCGGELLFEPSSQKYHCEYCGARFSQSELDELTPSEGTEYKASGNDAADDTEYSTSYDAAGSSASADSRKSGAKAHASEEAVVYNCPSCGAEIVTSETTAATFCYYCHNPVVLKGRLSDEYLPDSLIPFKIDQKQAVEEFKRYIKKKKFVPRSFSSDSQIEKLTGVYYPYWVYESNVDADLDAKATKVHVMRHGDEEITETNVYEVHRGGPISFRNMTRSALQSDHRKMIENVQPYQLQSASEFHMGYLSGFQAERRDMEKQMFADELHKEVKQYAEKLMRDQVSGYTTVDVRSTSVHTKNEKWKYCLLPAWILTYQSAGTTYYFAMNGQTGAIAGKLPIDRMKLGITSLVSGGILAAVLSAILYFFV